MIRTLAAPLALALALTAPPLLAQDDAFEPFSPDELDNLLAPVALYPDPLLAQVLVAATFPNQIDDAARFVRSDPNPEDLDDQRWNDSVKAVAHYPEVLDMMADKLDWTTALGQAYVSQSTDVMAAVQRLRARARAAGNLVSSPEMQVVDEGGEIELWPAQPQYIWVPRYDPAAVFFFRAPLFFPTRFFIGAWLNCAFDWRAHRVFYHGWEHGPAWIQRSRPFIHFTNVYVHPGGRDIVVNRNIVRRHIDYGTLRRYDDIHRGVTFERFPGKPRVGAPPPPPVVRETIHNKIIARSFNTRDARLNEFRGHLSSEAKAVHGPEVPAFSRGSGGFDVRAESRRGQSSRAQVQRPPPRPAPQQERKRR